jgi:hypothetical protein
MSALDPLLLKVEALAPRFGRLEPDIAAMASRGRSGDFKGVMQNARLVCEALLRSVVRDDLKQQLGRAMLDELVQKFRQPANSGVVPTNILAHIGTVQAWGNLSSHDHAGSLTDQGVKVGPEEALASLNSMVAILSWYAESRAAVQTAPAPSAPTGTRRGPLVGAALGAVLAVVGIASQFRASAPVEDTRSFAALDVAYATWREPQPPPPCRDARMADRLSRIVSDTEQLKLVEPMTPEVAYLRARAQFELKKDQAQIDDLLARATACDGFAAAHKLMGRVAQAKGNTTAAEAAFTRAVSLAPTFMSARLGRLGLWLEDPSKRAELIQEAEALVAADPSLGKAVLLRGLAKKANGDLAGAGADFCKAKALGEASAPCTP